MSWWLSIAQKDAYGFVSAWVLLINKLRVAIVQLTRPKVSENFDDGLPRAPHSCLHAWNYYVELQNQ